MCGDYHIVKINKQLSTPGGVSSSTGRTDDSLHRTSIPITIITKYLGTLYIPIMRNVFSV